MTLEEARGFFSNDRFATGTTGIVLDEIGDGRSVCSLTVTEKHLAAHNRIMGGVIYTLADFAFAAATNTDTVTTVTVTSTVNYIGQAKDDRLVAECRCIKNGRRTCLCETEIHDGSGNQVAFAVSTGMHI